MGKTTRLWPKNKKPSKRYLAALAKAAREMEARSKAEHLGGWKPRGKT